MDKKIIALPHIGLTSITISNRTVATALNSIIKRIQKLRPDLNLDIFKENDFRDGLGLLLENIIQHEYRNQKIISPFLRVYLHDINTINIEFITRGDVEFPKALLAKKTLYCKQKALEKRGGTPEPAVTHQRRQKDRDITHV